MKKKMKLRNKILSGLLIVVLVFGIIVGAVIMYLDGIVASAMRKLGTAATGTELKVQSVGISLAAGNLTINKLTIANPTGYESPNAFWVEKLEVDLDVNSVFTDTIIVEKVEIEDIWIDFEPTLNGSNLTDIKKNIMKFAKSQKAEEKKSEETTKKEEPAPAGKSKKVIIKSFVIKKGTINVASRAMPSNISVTLNKLTLTNVGQDNVTGEVFGQILDAIMEQVAVDVAAAKIEGLTSDVLNSKLLKDVSSQTEEIGKGVGKTLKDITDKIF